MNSFGVNSCYLIQTCTKFHKLLVLQVTVKLKYLFFIHTIIQVEYEPLTEVQTSNFQWIDVENLTEYRQCRNSVQGPDLIVDERGKSYVILSIQLLTCRCETIEKQRKHFLSNFL